jgi:hypothetical protein
LGDAIRWDASSEAIFFSSPKVKKNKKKNLSFSPFESF